MVVFKNDNKKERLDILLVKRKLVVSRNQARFLIEKGKVKVNGVIFKKPAKLVGQDVLIDLDLNDFYVSRAGLKLKAALDYFKISVKDKVCLDVGSAKGGFIDCLLKSKAKLVYGVDVGQNQLAENLKNNKKVIFFEKTDIRNFKENIKVDLITVDVSFISLKLVVPFLKNFLKEKGEIVLLFKPQFEVGLKFLKKGIVKNQKLALTALENFLIFLKKFDFIFVDYFCSVLPGKKGNLEYFIYLKNKI